MKSRTARRLHAGAAAHAGLREPEHPGCARSCGARERLMEERGDQRVQVYRALADYLSRSTSAQRVAWSYPLKTLPRPKGKATRVDHHRIRSAARDDPAA